MERTGQDLRQAGSFLCKKWTLFTFCAIGIVVTIIMAAVAGKILESYINDNFPNDSQSYKDSLKSAALVWIWIISGLSILFHLVGLMGAYKEHYCMTVTYAVLITLSALGSITYSTKNPYYWFETVLFFIICGISYAFAYDLRRIRVMQFSAPAMIVIGGGNANAVINMGPGQYAPAGQAYVAPQYAGQYGQPSTAQPNWNPPQYAPSEHKPDY